MINTIVREPQQNRNRNRRPAVLLSFAKSSDNQRLRCPELHGRLQTSSTFLRMRLAVAVQRNGLGSALCSAKYASIACSRALEGLEDTPANPLFRDRGEESFDLVDPRGTGRSEVAHESRVLGQPSLHCWGLMPSPGGPSLHLRLGRHHRSR